MYRVFDVDIRSKTIIFLSCTTLLYYLISTQSKWGFIICFVLFIPFFLYERAFKYSNTVSKLYLAAVFIALFVGNLISMTWMYKLGWVNLIYISMFYSLTFLPIFYLYHSFSKKSVFLGCAIFLLGWVSIELLHTYLEIGLPILSVGYNLATLESIIQWYQYIGVMGGSLWIILINILLFHTLIEYSDNKSVIIKNTIKTFFAIVLPVAISILNFEENEPILNNKSVLSIHTNLDCYHQKYDISLDSIQNYYLNLIRRSNPANVDLVLLPENAFPSLGWMSSINSGKNQEIDRLNNFRISHQIKNLLVGGVGYSVYKGNPDDNLLATYSKNSNSHILRYNMALNINDSRCQIRTKEKLVPFEETIPYPQLHWFFKKLYKSKGGFNFSRRKINELVFEIDKSEKVGTLICFESAFGQLARSMVREGSGFLAVILNEGWYDTISGAIMFENISKVRAIENQRWIVRSSNRGISSIISSKGKVKTRKQKSDAGGILFDVPILNQLSFYTRFGLVWHGIIVMVFLFFLVYGFCKLVPILPLQDDDTSV